MRTTRMLLAAVLTAVGLGAVSGSPATADPAPDAARWHVAATLGLGLDDVATSCPTVSVCTAAAGGELLTTTDGGATWSRSTPAVPPDVVAIVDVACPTTAVCVLLARRGDGSSVLVTGPGAGPFAEIPAPDTGTATALECPAARHCVVTDGAKVWITHDRGGTWRSVDLPLIVHFEQRLTCTAATDHCAVYGNNGLTPAVVATDDDGRTWTQPDPGPFDGLYALDCPTTSVCVAGGVAGGSALLRRTVDAGTTWKPVVTPTQSGSGVRSISCATPTSCAAFGLTPGDTPFAWSTANGTTWTAQPVTAVEGTPAPAVDCPAAGRCRAVGGGIAYVTDDGAFTWTSSPLPAVTQVPHGIDCPRADACVAVGDDAANRPLALTSTDRGTTWTPHPLPAAVGDPYDVDCVSGTDVCVTVGAYAPPGTGRTLVRTAVSTDLGLTWQVGRPTNARGVLRRVSCPTTTTCLAGGYDARSGGNLWTTADGGRTWTALTSPPGLGAVDAVSCAAATTCVVIGDVGSGRPTAYRTTDLGRTWRVRPLPGDPDDFTHYFGLDCSGATCVAVGARSGDGAITFSADGGVTWSRALAPREAQLLAAVSCSSETVCAATSFDFAPRGGAVAVGSRDGGATWVVHDLAAGSQFGSDISCTTARCYVPQQSAYGNPIVVTGRP